MRKIIDFLKRVWALVWHPDTLAHGGCCAAVSLALFVIFATPPFGFPLGLALSAGIIGAALAGLACEFVQAQLLPGWTKAEAVRDLIRDGIGIALALIPELIYICN